MSFAKPGKGFPTEVWIDILSSGGLSYFDFKRVAGVSKTFKAICELKIFDDILFRGSPTASLAEGDLIAVHPTLWEENSGLIGEDVQKFWVGNWEDDTKQFQIVKLLCASEFATCPPVNKLLLALGGEEIVENMNGVTVVDVVEGIAAAWRKQANFRVRRQDATKKYPEGSEKLMSYGEEIYRNERRFWVGWRTPRLLPDGTVVLRARPFSYWS